MRNRASGFTLIELLVVVAIIGILAAFAYPSYTQHLVKGRRANVQAYMMDVAQKQQQMLLDSRTYSAAIDTAAITAALGVASPKDVTNYYKVEVETTNGPPPTFTITATPHHSTQTEDGALTLDHSGARTPVDKW